MKSYIGTKIVQAEPMEAAQFAMSVREIPGVIPTIEGDGHSQAGYSVVYEDGYMSWSPKETFERAYREVTKAEKKLITEGL